MICIKDIEICGLWIRIGCRGDKVCFIGFPAYAESGKGSVKWLETVFKEEVKEGSSPLLCQLEKELEEYLRGERQKFSVEVDHSGTSFQQMVWAEVDKIGYGKSITYSEIAKALGKERSSRAVGNAVGANIVAILTPCHRVKGKNSEGGYLWGLEIKRKLLELEVR